MLKILIKIAILIAVSIVALCGRPLIAMTPDMTKEDIYHKEMNEWLDHLISVESMGNPHADIIDTNGRHSRGCLMFQDETLSSYSKLYGVSGSAFDCEFAKKLTVLIIEDDWKNWRNWWTSVTKKGVGYPPKKEYN